MQNPVPDERYYVANEAILGAFFKLSREKAPDKITVSDIIKAAGIARSTFYNHYQDIPSLVAAVEEKTICDVFAAHKEQIQSEVLAVEIKEGALEGYQKEWNINGHKVELGVEKQ